MMDGEWSVRSYAFGLFSTPSLSDEPGRPEKIERPHLGPSKLDAFQELNSRQQYWGHRANIQSDLLKSFGFVRHDSGEHTGIDVIGIAEDVHILWRPGMGPTERGVPLQRRLIILSTDAASLIEVRDVRMVLPFVGVDDAVGCKTCRSALRVVHNHDVLDAEQWWRRFTDGNGR